MTGPLGATSTGRARLARALRPVAVLLTSLAVAALAPSASTAAAPASTDGPAGRPTVHSSDGVIGPLAAPPSAARMARVVVTNEKSYRVVPGVRYRQWDQRDARG